MVASSLSILVASILSPLPARALHRPELGLDHPDIAMIVDNHHGDVPAGIVCSQRLNQRDIGATAREVNEDDLRRRLLCPCECFGCALGDCDEIALLLETTQIGFPRRRLIVDE
jgi:hypothetical protein